MSDAAPLVALPWTTGADGVRTAVPPQGSALAPLRLFAATDGGCRGVTGAAECGLLVLGGTFDLRAGGNGWGSRGARPDPFGGRPVAVFVPPDSDFAAAGTGEFLVCGAVPPKLAPPTGRAALHDKPLLPMAGSGKAYDPQTGEWKLHEEFASAAQAILPRHIERSDAGGVVVERVFAPAYKARGFCLDELVVPAGATFALQSLPSAPGGAVELLLFARPRGRATLHAGGVAHALAGDAAFALRLPAADLRIVAADGPCYAVLAWAGK